MFCELPLIPPYGYGISGWYARPTIRVDGVMARNLKNKIKYTKKEAHSLFVL